MPVVPLVANPVPVTFPPGTEGPCGWVIDTGCCKAFWDTLDADTQTISAQYAALSLWAATGRQFGVCEVTVRPCGRWCNDTGIGGWYWGGGMFLPFVVDGMWRNCWCGVGPGCCSCVPACQVWLPGPVTSVIEVTVDGVVVDPATYRVDDGHWLVRTGTGNCWPDCQDFNVSSGVGTMFVTYGRGEPPTPPLLRAAGTLACEYAKSCIGAECSLPAYITSISRQGIDFRAVDPFLLLENGFTGLFAVDSLIRQLNPYRQTHRPQLLSPDVKGPRMQTWP